jgi:hypothetical protein
MNLCREVPLVCDQIPLTHTYILSPTFFLSFLIYMLFATIQVLGRPEDKGNKGRPPPVHKVIFSHIPPFIYKPDEDNGYFNLNKHVRENLLTRAMEAGVTKWFCGHYHRNAGGLCGGLEVRKGVLDFLLPTS